MRRLFLVQCVVLATTGLTWGDSSTISFLWEQHRVWGSAGSDSTQPGEFPGGVYDSYNMTASYPISGSASGIEAFSPGNVYPVTAASSAGSLCVAAHGVRWTGWGCAESMYTFQPGQGAGFLTLDASGWREGHPFEVVFQLTLTDLTTQMIVEDFSWPGNSWLGDPADKYWSNNFVWSGIYPADASHTYSLRLYADAHGGDWKSDTSIQVGLDSVTPAPGAVLLCALGAGLVGWLRRRQAV